MIGITEEDLEKKRIAKEKRSMAIKTKKEQVTNVGIFFFIPIDAETEGSNQREGMGVFFGSVRSSVCHQVHLIAGQTASEEEERGTINC